MRAWLCVVAHDGLHRPKRVMTPYHPLVTMRDMNYQTIWLS